MLRQSALKRNEDPYSWITYFEKLRMKLEGIRSAMIDDRFLIHVLNNLTNEYEIQMVLLEKGIGAKAIRLKLMKCTKN